MLLSDDELARRALTDRLRDDAKAEIARAEMYERDSAALIQRAQRARSRAQVWSDAAQLLGQTELQGRDDAQVEESEHVHSEAH